MLMYLIFDEPTERFENAVEPKWHNEFLRDRGMPFTESKHVFGLYLYNLVRSNPNINSIIDVGTARGYSAACMAQAIADRGDQGVVRTIDRIKPTKPKRWHNPDVHRKDDPLKGELLTMREVVQRFYNLEGEKCPIKFVQEDAHTALNQLDLEADLVFHDVEQQYAPVLQNLETVIGRSETVPIQIVRDFNYYVNEDKFGFISGEYVSKFSSIPAVRHLLRKLQRWQITTIDHPGVSEAVNEVYESHEVSMLEVAKTETPLAVLYPESPVRYN